MRDRPYDEVMAGVFRKDPAYAEELKKAVEQDGDAEERAILTRQLEKALDEESGDNSEPLRLLREGYPIVYRDPDTPAGHVVKHFPDGHRELWTYKAGEGVKVGDMAPESA